VQLRICECWARDGIQPLSFVSTAEKLEQLDRIGRAGFGRVEVTSFADPRRWPQFADAEAVLKRYRRHEGVDYVVLTPNVRALERALSAQGDTPNRFDAVIAIIAASDAYTRKTLGRSTEDAIPAVSELIRKAKREGLMVIGCVGTAWGCPIQGVVPPDDVVALGLRLRDAGADELMLGDTTGEANPRTVGELVSTVAATCQAPVIAHFHDARGLALANAFAAIEAGATQIDCALGGTGGHPPDQDQRASAGNLCTEDFVTAIVGMGIDLKVDLPAVLEAGQWAETIAGHPLESRVQRSGVPSWMGGYN
jgi:hydroxymethylglutaryl-CoA lyase